MKQVQVLLFAAIFISACRTNKPDFDAAGTFEATEMTVASEANGKIISLDVSEGQEVKANESFGMIDTVQLYLSKLQLLQNLSSVRSSRPDINKQIAAVNEQIAKQKLEQSRIENMLKAGAATQKQFDDVTSALAVLESQLDALQSSLQKNTSSLDAQSYAIEIQIEQIEDQMDKCRIASPIDGVVMTKFVEAGELAVVGKPLLKVADTKRLYLRAYLTLAQLSDIVLRQKMTVYADFGRDNRREYEGKLIWISDKSEFTPKGIQTKDDRQNLVYAVKIAIENDGYVKIGMYGEVKWTENNQETETK